MLKLIIGEPGMLDRKKCCNTIAIIMPTYNRGHLISGAIQSILMQSFKDFGLVVIDDGSTDDTENIVKRYRDTRIVYFKKKHGGISSSKNYGISRTKSKYIGYCDDDCVYYPNHIKKLVNYLDKKTEVGLAYSDGICYLQNNDTLVHKFDFDKRRLESSVFFMSAFIICRRECFDKIGLFDDHMLAREDWEMLLRISDAYPIARVPGITGKHFYKRGIPTLTDLSDENEYYTECIIKGRIQKACREKRIIDYINDSAIALIKELLELRMLRSGSRFAQYFYGILKNYQTFACLGMINLGKGDFYAAIEWFEKSLKKIPADWKKFDSWHIENIITVKSFLAYSYYNIGDIIKAKRACSEIVETMPDHMGTVLLLAQCHITEGRIYKAMSLVKKMKNVQGMHNIRGICYLKQKKYDKAINEFKKIATSNRTSSIYHHNLVAAYMTAGRYVKAIKEYQTARKLKQADRY